MSDTPALDNIGLWENGDPLNFAWAKYADEFQLEKYKEATSTGPMLALQRLLVDDLFVKLHQGNLIALGHRISPEVSNGPIRIPKHCFAQRANLKEVGNDIVSASRWIYERVIIMTANPSVLLEIQPTISDIKVSQKRGGGNIGYYKQARLVLEEMHKILAFQQMTAGPMLEPFNQRYVSRYNSPERKVVGVSERALRDYLKRYRQELAGIGKV